MTNALKRLNRASAQLWQTQDLHSGLGEMLSATIELLGADFGNIQLFDPKDRVLRIAVHRGFKRSFLDHFREVSTKDNAACGRALRGGQRIIIEDVEKDAAYAPHRKIARSAGYRAVQSTPLMARDGRPLGMISTHFRAPHRPDEIDLQSLDLYIRQAADFIERCGVEQALRESRGSLEAILNSLSAQIAVVDAKGDILMVNEQWRLFARQHATRPEQVNEGASYFAVCELAVRNGAAEAGEFLKGMRAVLAGKKRDYSFEYPCHSPGIEQWFIARVTRFIGCGAPRVVVAHEDITARKLAEKALRESAERYRLLAEHTDDFVALSDAEGNVLYLSPSYERKLGVTLAALHSQGGRTWMHPDDAETIRNARAANLAGKSTAIEYRFLKKKPGEWIWLEGRCTPIRDASGRVAKLLLVSRDITSRKMVEAALHASEERYRQLVHSLPAAVYICDASGRITLYNAEAVKLWGREPTTKDRWDASHRILDAEGRPMKRSQLAIVEAVRSGEPLRGMERIVERADGSRSHVLCFPDPLHDASRRTVGALSMLVDITTLKETQSKLHAALSELQTLSHAVEQSPAMVVITSPEGGIEYVNPKFTSVTGYTSTEVLGKNPRLLKSGEQPPSFYKAMWETISAGKEWRGEFCNRRKSGELFWEYAVIAPIMGTDGKIRHFVAMKEDITEHRRSVTLLREREEKLRSILNTVVDAVITIDKRGIIIGVNPATERLFGYKEVEMIGRNVKMLMPSPYREEHDGYLRNYHRTGKARIIGIGREALARRKDGSVFPIELAVSQVDHMHIYTGVIRDITARRALEKEVLDISENERAAIGEDLHDDLGQQLAGLWCMSQVLHDSLKKREAPETAEAAKISEILGQVLTLTRSLAQGLHPVALETGGLVAALKDLAARTRLMFGVLCRFHGINRDTGLDQPTTTNLFRICQEAVTNAAKHAQATRIDITLSRREGRIVLTVRDDGCGLPESLPANRGMGMRIMQHRASLIGAELSIDHAPLGGTLMTCKIHPKTARCTK